MLALSNFYIANGFNSFTFPSQYKQHRNKLVVHTVKHEYLLFILALFMLAL